MGMLLNLIRLQQEIAEMLRERATNRDRAANPKPNSVHLAEAHLPRSSMPISHGLAAIDNSSVITNIRGNQNQSERLKNRYLEAIRQDKIQNLDEKYDGFEDERSMIKDMQRSFENINILPNTPDIGDIQTGCAHG